MRLRAGPWRRCATATASASRSRIGASTSSSHRRNWRGARRHRLRCRSAAMHGSTAARSCKPTAAAISISCASTRLAMAAPEPMPAHDLPERARALLDMWFGAPGDTLREERREVWFKSTPGHDSMLRELFLADYERADAGLLADWEAVPESALALVLLLDQIPRNIFRATPRCYASDAMARAVAERAMARGFDRQMAPAWRLFLYMPLHHSENLADQQRATALVASLPGRRDPEHGENRRYGLPYVDVIERFGRFPHRNAILGRESTPEELAFLAGREPER